MLIIIICNNKEINYKKKIEKKNVRKIAENLKFSNLWVEKNI